eukprot:467645_1
MGPDLSALETLELLRSWAMAKKHPILDEKKKEVIFDDVFLKFSKQTAWYSKQKGKFYSIAALALFLKYSEGTGVSEYIRHSNSLQLPFVSVTEKNSLLRYLRGEIETAPEVLPEEKVGGVDGKVNDVRAGGSSVGKSVAQAKSLSDERVAAAKEKLAGVMRIDGGGSNTAGNISALLLEDKNLEIYLALDRSLVTEIRAGEVRESDRNSTLRRPTKEFKFAWDYYMALRRKEKNIEGNASHGDKKRLRSDHGGSYGLGQGRKSNGGSNNVVSRTAANVKLPIIIVPSTPTAMLTLFNIREFLIDGGYISSTRKKAEISSKPLEVKLTQALPSGKLTQFAVVDNPRRLTDDEWNRVVCVVVQGAAWQFKEFKWKQPVNLFQHVLGIHLKYDDVELEPRVAGWNVQVVQISKDKRHLDKAASLEFWRLLDKFVHTSIKT